MTDRHLDSVLKHALAWRAQREIARQAPTRLALRRLAVSVRAAKPTSTSSTRLRGKTAGQRDRRPRSWAINVAGLAAMLIVGVVVATYFAGSVDRFGATGPLHVSERHGYSIALPDGSWRVTEQPGEWEVGAFLGAESSGSDYFDRRADPDRSVGSAPSPLVYMWMSSQTIPPGMSFDGWLYAQDGVTAAAAPCFVLQGEYEQVRVGGEAGRLGYYYCDDFDGSGTAWATMQVLFAHGGRGYAMYFWPEQEPALAPKLDIRREVGRWLSRFAFVEASPR
jgi:hypothetical protein